MLRACLSAPQDNVIDHFGLTFLFAENDVTSPTTVLGNDTFLFSLHRPRGCSAHAGHAAAKAGAKAIPCLRAGFLPHYQFPRWGSWPILKSAAYIHHIVGGDAALGPEHANPPGLKPSRGPRQRLDRYDDEDFDGYEAAMRAMGLWLVDDSPEYRVARAGRRKLAQRG